MPVSLQLANGQFNITPLTDACCLVGRCIKLLLLCLGLKGEGSKHWSLSLLVRCRDSPIHILYHFMDEGFSGS